MPRATKLDRMVINLEWLLSMLLYRLEGQPIIDYLFNIVSYVLLKIGDAMIIKLFQPYPLFLSLIGVMLFLNE